jgi:PmbA protein
MERYIEPAQYVLEKLKERGAEDAECCVINSVNTELNWQDGDLTLMRTYPDVKVALRALSSQRAGSASAARFEKEALDEAVDECIASMKSATPDEYESAALPEEGQKTFTQGELAPDADRMLERFVEYMEHAVKEDPERGADDHLLTHIRRDQVFINSRGVDLQSKQGYYAIGPRRGDLFVPDLTQSLIGIGEVDLPFDRPLRREPVKPLGEKFCGTVVFHPRFHRLFWWLSTFVVFSETNMTGEKGSPRNRWADKLGEKVASDCLSLSYRPLDPRVCNASPFTKDGYPARNVEMLKDGVFREMPLSARAAKMLGRTRNFPPPGHDEDDLKYNIFVEPGTQSIREIIKGIDKGLVVFSLPGAMPGDVTDGDIAGIVRNGLLIENGEITRPISEVMVSHNYYEMLKNVRAVSSECRYTGGDMTPWIAVDGYTVQ